MRKFIVFHFVLVLAAACSQNSEQTKWQKEPLSERKPESLGFIKEMPDIIDFLFEDYISRDQISGAAALIARKGEIVYYRAIGYDDLKEIIPLKKDGIFRAASQTKALTSVAVMILYEEDLIDIDAPVSDYLPEFSNPTVLKEFNPGDTSFVTEPASREVTLRDLLTHTSGYCYMGSGGEAINSIYAKAGIMGGIPEKSTTLKEEMQKLAEMPLAFEPGESFCYGLSTDILGYLVEEISGQSLENFFRSRILEPLGMNDTYFSLPEEMHDRLMTLHMDGENGLVEANSSLMNYPKREDIYNSGGGGISSTTMDYAIFIQMLLNEGTYNGVRILKPETVQKMFVNQIGDLQAGSLFIPGSADKFGLGFEVIQPADKSATPIPAGSYGWGGAFGSLYWIDKENDMIVHLVMQKVGNYQQIRYDFIDAVYNSLNFTMESDIDDPALHHTHGLSGQYNPCPVDADVWVLAGQSNMQGAGRTSDDTIHDQIWMMNLDDTWRRAESPLHRVFEARAPAYPMAYHQLYGNAEKGIEHTFGIFREQKIKSREDPIGGTGPGIYFARRIHEVTEKPVGLIPCALGGSTIEQWDPAGKQRGDSTLYGAMINRIMSTDRKDVKGLVWYQGESEAMLKLSGTYEAKLLNFIDSFRKDVKRPDLPIVIVQIGRFLNRNPEMASHWEIVRNAQLNILSKRENIYLTTGIDLPLDDCAHISTHGNYRLGNRIADIVLTNMYNTDEIGNQIIPYSMNLKKDSISGSHYIYLRYKGVTGKLKTDGLVTCFELRFGNQIRISHVISKVVTDPADPAGLRLYMSALPDEPFSIICGPGLNPHMNVTDSQDMPIPAFGPVDIDVQTLRSIYKFNFL